MPKLFLTTFIGCSIFYSVGVFAEKTSTESLMADLNQIFQSDLEIIKEHDELLDSTVSNLEGCPYKDTWKHNFQSAIYDNCNELVEKIQTEELSYFLLTKKINDNQNMDEERKVFLQDILAEAYEVEEEVILEQKELIEYLGTQLNSCPNDEIEEGMESFTCSSLIEEAVNTGLSYFQVRDAIQSLTPKAEPVAHDEAKPPKKIAKP